MNRKAFLILIGLLVVLGGAGFALFWQDLSAWRGSDTKIGSKPFEKLPVNAVTQIHIVDGKGEVTLMVKDQRWVVKQRNDYNANYQDISDLLVKLPDIKVVQTENVGPALLPRLNLVQPGKSENKDAKNAESVGTLLELSDKDGKVLVSTLLGKKVIKIEDSPLPIKQEKPVGRYVLNPGNQTVLVLSDGLVNVEAKPEGWLSKDFFKVDRAKSIVSGGSGPQWKLVRDDEFGRWNFADGKGLINSVALETVKAFSEMTFTDVALDVKPESLDKPRVFAAETFDNLVYTIKLAKKADGDDYYVSFTVTGEPPRERKPDKWEKAEDKERLGKYFVDDLKRLDARLKREKSLNGYTFVVAGKTLERILKDRAEITAGGQKK